MNDTLPPTSAETEALAIFEALIRELGERRARVIHLSVLLGECHLCVDRPSDLSYLKHCHGETTSCVT